MTSATYSINFSSRISSATFDTAIYTDTITAIVSACIITAAIYGLSIGGES